MSALFSMPISSEILLSEEIAVITGCSRKADQIEWLKNNNWRHYKNKAGEPIVGRLYARLQLSGIRPSPDDFDCNAPSFNLVK
jgi:hypothetical protein